MSLLAKLSLVVLVQYWKNAYAFNTASFSTAVTSTSTTARRAVESTSLLTLYTSSSDQKRDDEDEPTRLKRKADQLREEIRSLEEKLQQQSNVRRTTDNVVPSPTIKEEEEEEASLKGKTVLVVGANGRLGSMVCRYLLRNNPKTQVVAAVHYVGEASTRGYGRLSYEVGAEDGKGFINAAWNSNNSDEGNNNAAYFEFTDEMKSYNLQNLRVVDVELLNPVQCITITENVDCVVWCATDFDGNVPRSISGPLNLAFLFRAVANPTKGRVEIEGLTNILAGLKNSVQSRRWQQRKTTSSDSIASQLISSLSSPPTTTTTDMVDTRLGSNKEPTSFVLISASETAFDDFETPFGSFNGLKRDGERIATQEFPSLSTCVLRMSRYDDNFVGEDLDIQKEDINDVDEEYQKTRRRRINRRDAARAAVDALTDPSCKGKIVNVWTAA